MKIYENPIRKLNLYLLQVVSNAPDAWNVQCYAITQAPNTKLNLKDATLCLVCRQEKNAATKDDCPDHGENNLSLPTTLHERRPATIFHHGAGIVGEPIGQTRETQHPKDNSERQSHAPLETGRLIAKMEGDDDGQRDNGEIHGQAEP